MIVRPANPSAIKSRLPNNKRTTGASEEWEGDSEATEETGYTNRNNKFDDDDE